MLGGSLEGNPDVVVDRPAKIEEATAGTLTFLANPKYEAYAYTTQASILLVARDFSPTQKVIPTLIRLDDVYAAVTILLEKFGAHQNTQSSKIDEKAAIHTSAKIGDQTGIGAFSVVQKNVTIGDNCNIFPQVFIGENVRIGNHVTLHPGVRIYHGCSIGDHCILHANVVVGADGFGFAPQADGSYKKVSQIGNVLIENNVEIGANTTIDRATMGSTIIRAGAKIDNLVMIAHNVEIGSHTVIAAQAGIAGSTKIGEKCMIGGQSGFVGHIKIADGTKVQAQSGVAAAVETPNTALYGSPALPYSNYLKSYAIFKQLPDLIKKIRSLEKKIDEIKTV